MGMMTLGMTMVGMTTVVGGSDGGNNDGGGWERWWEQRRCRVKKFSQWFLVKLSKELVKIRM